MGFENINIGALLQSMLGAASGILVKKWPDVQSYAESEFKGFLSDIQNVGTMYAQQKITEEQATALVKLHVHSMNMVLMTVEGISLIMAEQAINAALVQSKAQSIRQSALYCYKEAVLSRLPHSWRGFSEWWRADARPTVTVD